MSIFLENQRISIKDDIQKKGRIDRVHKPSGGNQFYDLILDNGSFVTKAEHELIQEVLVFSPWDLFKQGNLSEYKNYSVANTIHKVRNTSANTLSTLKASRTLFKAYQFLPLVKMLRTDQRRILVADEVGLGKTIEAGHILLELLARGEVKNMLVLCSKSLREKWRLELENKFNVKCRIYDDTKGLIRDIEDGCTSNKKDLFCILNYEKFARNPNKVSNCLEACDYTFDLIICDEVHKLRNITNTSKNLKLHIANAKAVVFLTATPIMTDLNNLYHLLLLLDPEEFNNYEIFYNSMEMNKPFIKAVGQINSNVNFSDISSCLKQTELTSFISTKGNIENYSTASLSKFMSGDELFEMVLNQLDSLENNVTNRVKIQRMLLELNSLNHIFSRTRKKDVLDENDVVERDVKTVSIELTDSERYLYQDLINQYDEKHSLGLITKKRQISSSIVAYHSNREDLINGQYDTKIFDSKFEKFIHVLNKSLSMDQKLIVFAFFTNTLLYLKAKLEEKGFRTEIIYGQIKNRDERIEHFKNNSEIQVLLSSEVGSEGLDLQFCNTVINYDLPWNPMVVEQRIGRIDRIGQKSKIINVFNFILKDTIEEMIYERLFRRIELFKSSLGAIEEILGDVEDGANFITKGIEELYRSNFSEKEIHARLDRAAMAFHQEEKNLETIAIELTDTLTNDAYFKGEITRIRDNRRYLTSTELENFVKSLIEEHLPFLLLTELKPELFSLQGSRKHMKLLFDFIKKHIDAPHINPEVNKLYRDFFLKNEGALFIELTFSQEFAFKEKKVEYISAFHPLINAISNYFIGLSREKNQVNKITISSEFLEEITLTKGLYLLVIFNMNTTKYANGLLNGKNTTLHTLCIDFTGEQIQFLENDKSDLLNGIMEEHGEPFSLEHEIDYEVFVESFREQIMQRINSFESDLQIQNEAIYFSSLKRKINQEIDFLEKRVKRNNKMLSEGQGIANIIQAEINNAEQRKMDLQAKLANSKLIVEHGLVSINLVQIK